MTNKLFDKILALSMLAWMSVAANLGNVGFIINGLINELQITDPGLKGLLGSSSLIGMLIGAFISGFFGDHIGRKKTAIIFALLHGVSGVIAVLVVDPLWFITWRILAGIGLGGLLPVLASLVSEYSLPSSRGKRVSLLESSWAFGWLIPITIAYLYLDSMGWLIYGLVTSIVALILSLSVLFLEESPRYLLLIGREDEARRLVEKYGIELPKHISTKTNLIAGARLLFSKDLGKTTIGLWIIWFTITMGYYGLFIWYPRLLSTRGAEIGFEALANYLKTKRLEYLLIITLAQIPGYYSAVFLVDRIGRKKLLGTYLVLTGLSAFMLAYARFIDQFLAAGMALSFFDLGAWAAVYTYTPEQYPTNIRVLGTGWASTIGRLGGILGPYIVPFLRDWQSIFMFFATIHFVGALGVLTGKELARKEMVE
ncbi:MFS transporter [Staphylothermus hellenicus]|uniref:Major facilitator superfamily MFS_1 n=1 Tax=Staphylothermus hellenicus (strain DSM 12710 / JCM 10830 / BK20S6-10-b1 / P8) TaxID=591019 RepID=D7D9P4_STAHD|nr:MFS transporter [Staphylothermus hellenicus]ADI32490.1 major facilitator superfamily MFS_1 [Staphylothermus hellenicus DSM 12710]